MINIDDTILNKYLDGELTGEELVEVRDQLMKSESLRRKLNALKLVDENLKKIESYHLPSSFAAGVMNKLSLRAKAKKEQRYFIISVSSVFIIISLIIIGFILSNVLTFESSSASQINMEGILTLGDGIAGFISGIFSSKNISILGSIISGGIVITAYFFYDVQRRTGQKFGK